MEFKQKYTLGDSIPTSSNNDMYIVKRNSDGKIFMGKKVHYHKMEQKQKQQIVQQVNILTEINSSYVVKYHQHFVQKLENTLYVVMEYEPKDLSYYLREYQREGKPFSEEYIWKLLKNIVLALKDIHKNKKGIILHRNIQPKSIFISNSSIKLGNFKFVKKLSEQQEFATTILTDSYYMCPEQLDQGVYTSKSDIWALGCLLYEICTFRKPFEGTNNFKIGENIRQGKIKPIPNFYKKELYRVIRLCLARDPKDRPTVQDLLGIPNINLLIRQSRLREVSKKIIQKQNKNTTLSEQILCLEEKIQAMKNKTIKKSMIPDLTLRSKSSIHNDLKNYGTNTMHDLQLKRGKSDQVIDKSEYLRNLSVNISLLNCPSGDGYMRNKQNLIRKEDYTYRNIKF